MKVQILLLPLYLAQAIVAAPTQSEQPFTENEIWRLLQESPHMMPAKSRHLLAKQSSQLAKRNPQDTAFSALTWSLATSIDGWSATRPLSKIPDVQQRASNSFPGAIEKKIRYGPFRIPPISERKTMSIVQSSRGVSNHIKLLAKKPCDGDCIVQSIAASMEFDDGKTANEKSGAWLHHIVLLNIGTKVNDIVCGGNIEYMFESGNEKTAIDYAMPDSSTKMGYHVRSQDAFVINTELQNMDDKEKWGWVTLTFHYIDGSHPEYKESKVIWLAIGPPRCSGDPDINPFGATNITATMQPTKQIFAEHSIPWKIPSDGLLMGANSHMHDGGVDMEVFKSNKLICDSYPQYDQNGVGAMGGISNAHGHKKRQSGSVTPGITPDLSIPVEHITKQSGCRFPKDPIPIQKGELMHVVARYNFTKHPGNTNLKGELDAVMGIAGSLIAFDYPMERTRAGKASSGS